jgi:hypothetical protein
VLVDGEASAELGPGAMPAPGACRNGCVLQIELETRSLTEEGHTLAVRATDDRGELGADVVDVTFADAPELTIDAPEDGENLAGVGQAQISISVRDRSPIEISLLIDGEAVDGGPTETDGRCGSSCSISYDWLTEPLAEGAHTIDLQVTDPFGRQATARSTVELADILLINAIEVTGESDGADRLEVEVHLFESETNIHIGCSGENSGLEQVDGSDVRYSVFATFEGTSAPGPVTAASIADRDVVIRVIEDDNGACPSPPGAGDDSIGTSAPIPGAELPTLEPMQFGSVVHLELDSGRPFSR